MLASSSHGGMFASGTTHGAAHSALLVGGKGIPAYSLAGAHGDSPHSREGGGGVSTTGGISHTVAGIAEPSTVLAPTVLAGAAGGVVVGAIGSAGMGAGAGAGRPPNPKIAASQRLGMNPFDVPRDLFPIW